MEVVYYCVIGILLLNIFLSKKDKRFLKRKIKNVDFFDGLMLIVLVILLFPMFLLTSVLSKVIEWLK